MSQRKTGKENKQTSLLLFRLLLYHKVKMRHEAARSYSTQTHQKLTL